MNITPSLFCKQCRRSARLTSGAEVYAHRPDLHYKPIWICDGCGGYVGCHDGGTRPLGTPATLELRNARIMLHNKRVDPLWQWADRCGLYKPEDVKARRRIRKSARFRVYSFLAHHLGLTIEECHIGMFDLDTCRRAWAILTGVTYPQIREWALAIEKEKEIAKMITGRDIELAKKWDAEGDMRELDNGGWSIVYRNVSFPRMTRLVKTASNKPEDPVEKTTFVDGVVCKSLEELLRRLNGRAPSQRSQERAA